MRMGMGLSLRQGLTLSQKLRLHQSNVLSLRLALIQVLREEEYKPEAVCPDCGASLELVDILSGFNQDPDDFTTRCPKCKRRFQPKLVCKGQYGSVETLFFCAAQTLDKLPGKEDLDANAFLKTNAALYRSAIFHFGSITNAFRKVGRQYQHEDLTGWREKVVPFLGRLSDVTISHHVNASADSIGKLRRKLNIPPYIKKQALEELEEE